MPVVPRADQSLIGSAPRPAVRLPTDVPASAFGVPEGYDLSGVERHVREIAQDARQKADQIAFMDADSQASALETKVLVDPQTGALNLKGKNAFNAMQIAGDAWQKGVAEIEQGLTTDQQRMAFRRAMVARSASINDQVQRHVATQITAYDQDTTKSYIANEQNAAIASYQNPDRVQLATARVTAAYKDFGRRNGLPDEQVQALTQDAVTKVHAGVISRFLSNDQDLAAKAYYDKVKDQIAGSVAPQIEKALDEGSTLGQAQRHADEILATKGITRSDAFDKAYAIEDPKVRQATVQQLDDRYARQDRVEREQHSDFLKRAAEYADRGELAPASLRAQLTAPERRSLESYRRSVVRGEPIETDWSTYYELRQKASDPKTRAEFLKTNLLRYRDKLANSEFEELIKLQTNVGQSGDRAQRGFLTDMDIVQKTIEPLFPDSDRSTGKGRDQKRARDAFIREIDVAVQDEKERIGKATLPSETVQKIADAMVLRRAFASGKLGVDERDNADQQYLTADKQGRPVVPTEQIPEMERTKLFGFLRRNRLAASTSKIERLYAAILLRVPQATFDRIAQEP